MRTYAGDTSLPGGKVELEDKTIEDTAVSSVYCVLFIIIYLLIISVEKPLKK